MKFIKSLLLCLLLLTAGRVHAFYNANASEHILLINSYFPSKDNSRVIVSAFSHRIRYLEDCRLTLEYMDSESKPEFAHWTEWISSLGERYAQAPDVVVILGSEAWSAYTVACPEEWRQVPVVLGYVKNSYFDYEHAGTGKIRDSRQIRSIPMRESFGDFKVTGYYLEDYYKENFELIRRLQPEVRHVAYIYDNRYGFDFMTSVLEKEARNAGFEDLKAYYGNELTTRQLLDTILTQDASHAVLSSGWYTDVDHYPHAFSMLHNELVLYRSKFMYSVMDQGRVSPDVYLGGYYVSGEDIGHDIADLTSEVMTRGIEYSPRFQRTPSSPRYYINSRTLESSGVNPARLPEDAVLLNVAPTFWKTYFWQIIVGSLVLLIVLSIFAARMIYFQRIARVKARMMEEQRQLREQADESNRLKSTFLANMSHEIRTPLNAIVGFSGLIAEAETREEMQQYMEIIETNNELLLQLVNDILDLSKIEAGQLDFFYTDTDLAELCRNLEQVYQGKVKPGVKLVCELPEEHFVISTEKNRVTQVISNFLNNAAKFTEQGSIRFGYTHIPAGLRVFVTDTGKGIAAEYLPKVFVRFEKFDRFGPGNGLGMAICKSIVEKLGGTIGVESVLGKGSTFWFELPVDTPKKKSSRSRS